MPAARGTTLTTTVRVIDRVHGNAANCRPYATPAARASLTQLAQVVFRVACGAQCGAAIGVHLAHLTRTQTQGGVVSITGNELHRGTSTACQLGALANLQLDAMHRAADRDVAQRHAVTNRDWRIDPGADLVARLHACRRDNIATFAVCILDQRDMRGTVRIVLETFHETGHAILVTLEVNDAETLLVTTAFVARGDVAIVVTPAGLGLFLDQRSIRGTLVQPFALYLDDVTATR